MKIQFFFINLSIKQSIAEKIRLIVVKNLEISLQIMINHVRKFKFLINKLNSLPPFALLNIETTFLFGSARFSPGLTLKVE